MSHKSFVVLTIMYSISRSPHEPYSMTSISHLTYKGHEPLQVCGVRDDRDNELTLRLVIPRCTGNSPEWKHTTSFWSYLKEISEVLIKEISEVLVWRMIPAPRAWWLACLNTLEKRLSVGLGSNESWFISVLIFWEKVCWCDREQ